MVSSIINLIAHNAQDIYLHGTSQLTYYVFRPRHTQFSMPSIHGNNDFDSSDSGPLGVETIHYDTKTIYKILGPSDNDCVITYASIGDNVEYWQCDTCDKVACWEFASIWIEMNKNCPHCRSKTTLEYKYINSANNI